MVFQYSIAYFLTNHFNGLSGNARHWRRVRGGVLLLGLMCQAPSGLADAPWIMIDTTSQRLSVIQGGEVKERIFNISLGRNGYGRNRYRGDKTTPLGEFRVAWINTNSQFRTFFGLDYPNIDHAKDAVNNDMIDYETYLDILAAIYRGRLPPQNTVLGGYIGIHGLGKADPKIHDRLNWTRGCVAVTNEQIDALGRWIKVGTRVVIAEGSLAALDNSEIGVGP